MCDHLDVCWCSEKSISTDDFRALLPSRCSLGHSFCQVFTNLFLFYHGFDATSEILFAWFLQICFFFTMVLMLLQAFILPGFCKSKSVSFPSFSVFMLLQGTCNSLGRVNGTCDRFGCTCSERLVGWLDRSLARTGWQMFSKDDTGMELCAFLS